MAVLLESYPYREMDSNSLGGSAEPAKLRVFIAQSRVMVSRQMGAWYHNLSGFALSRKGQSDERGLKSDVFRDRIPDAGCGPLACG